MRVACRFQEDVTVSRLVPIQVVLALMVLGLTGQVVSAQEKDERRVWQRDDGGCRFVNKGKKNWVEEDKDGKVAYRFIEVKRTDEYIDISDKTRGYTLRLTKEEMLIKGGNDDVETKFEDFTKYYEGAWAEE
jgi:hypothetical protein